MNFYDIDLFYFSGDNLFYDYDNSIYKIISIKVIILYKYIIFIYICLYLYFIHLKIIYMFNY